MSYTEFEQGKSQFFREIKVDADVIGSNSETEIRTLFDGIIVYANLANSARHVSESRKSKNIGDTDPEAASLDPNPALQHIFDARKKPIALHIDDITDIAYTVGIVDKKNKPKALSKDLEICQQAQKKLIDSGELDSDLFSDDTFEVLSLLNSGKTPAEQEQALVRLLEIASDHMNRSIALRRLGDAQDEISNYRLQEAVYSLKQVLKGNSSHITSHWNSQELSSGRLDELSRYLLQMAEINAAKFKMLLILINTITLDPHPVDTTNTIYDDYMETYHQFGHVIVNLSFDSSQPNHVMVK